MPDDSDSRRRGESTAPEIDRRTLTKLAGMAGVAVLPAASGCAEIGLDEFVVRETDGETGSPTEAEPDGDTTKMIIKLEPTFDRVLIQRTDGEETDSGSQTGDGSYKGTVRATGPDVEQVAEGESVLFDGSGATVEISGEEHEIIEEPAILGLIEE